jgi:hypothetical protein
MLESQSIKTMESGALPSSGGRCFLSAHFLGEWRLWWNKMNRLIQLT